MDRGEILDEAKRLTYGDRNQAYGPPGPNMQHTADMWNAYLNKGGDRRFQITAHQVPFMLAMTKFSRDAISHKDDNFIDAAAYCAIAGEVAAEGQIELKDGFDLDEVHNDVGLHVPKPYLGGGGSGCAIISDGVMKWDTGAISGAAVLVPKEEASHAQMQSVSGKVYAVPYAGGAGGSDGKTEHWNSGGGSRRVTGEASVTKEVTMTRGSTPRGGTSDG